MNIILVHSATFDNYPFLKRKMDKITNKLDKIEGLTRKIDKAAQHWFWKHGSHYLVYQPDEDTEDMMGQAGKKGVVIAFTNEELDREVNKLIFFARKCKLQVRVIKYREEEDES